MLASVKYIIARHIEQKMNLSKPEHAVQWLFLDLNAFFASCEQQENPALRGQRVPRYKPLSVGVVLLDLVPAGQHQPDLFAADNGRRQKLSPLIDRINDRFGRCSIGFGLFLPDVRAFKGHAAFHRVPERWEF